MPRSSVPVEAVMRSATFWPGLGLEVGPGRPGTRSARSHPVAPSNAAPAIPAPVSFRNCLRLRGRDARVLTVREVTMPRPGRQAGCAAAGERGHRVRGGVAGKIHGMRSVLAVSGGMLVAFVLVLLIVFGILAPVLSWLFQLDPSSSAFRTFAPLLLFVCGLSFYFGGMAAAFKAPARHRLHGPPAAPGALE